MKFNLRYTFRDDETHKMMKLFELIDKNASILDVGCGYGRHIKLLKSFGFWNILGVEKNKLIVESISDQLNVVHTDKFNPENNEKYDVIIFSHIIEHFEYQNLIRFMEGYLSHLKKNGYLYISTPLPGNEFYTNFDHVKPYLPDAIRNVFQNDRSQMQFHSKERLKLIALEFRKAPFVCRYSKSFYIGKPNPALSGLNIISSCLFSITKGLIGKSNGWMGLYQKL